MSRHLQLSAHLLVEGVDKGSVEVLRVLYLVLGPP